MLLASSPTNVPVAAELGTGQGPSTPPAPRHQAQLTGSRNPGSTQPHHSMHPQEQGTSLSNVPFLPSPWRLRRLGGREGEALPAGPKPVPPGLVCMGEKGGESRARADPAAWALPGTKQLVLGLQPTAWENLQPQGRSRNASPSRATVGCSLHHPQPRGDLRIAAHTRPTADCPQGRSCPGSTC